MHAISKTFGTTRVLHDAHMSVTRGQVHGLIGQNGSGKSTLVKILAGYHPPDRGGRMLVGGQPVRLPAEPKALRALGVSVVHQDLGLIPDLTVAENVGVGTYTRTRVSRRIRWREEAERAEELFQALQADVDPRAIVETLSPAQRSMVAIARAMRTQRAGEGVIVLDEATRSMPEQALADFYAALRRVVTAGSSAILVCHDLEEVMNRTDAVTVLRNGEVAGAAIPTRETSAKELARLMLGGHFTATVPERRAVAESPDIRVRDLSGPGLDGVDLTVASGEIVGLTGLAGAGWEEVPYLVSGARKAKGGTLAVGGDEADLRRGGVRDLLKLGVALVPENRPRDGVALGLSVRENISLPRVRSKSRAGWIGRGWERLETREIIRNLGITPPLPDHAVGHLSGGNQQKVLLGKWLAGRPRLLLLHEPSQGVDVRARQDILGLLAHEAGRGAGIVMASIQPDDLAAVCHRVLVIGDGRITAELTRPAAEDIIHAVYGGLSPTPGEN